MFWLNILPFLVLVVLFSLVIFIKLPVLPDPAPTFVMSVLLGEILKQSPNSTVGADPDKLQIFTAPTTDGIIISSYAVNNYLILQILLGVRSNLYYVSI